MIEDDEGIAVARRFERVDERIAFFDGTGGPTRR